MANGFFKVPAPKNEPVLSYAPGSEERKRLKAAIEELRSKQVDDILVVGWTLP